MNILKTQSIIIIQINLNIIAKIKSEIINNQLKVFKLLNYEIQILFFRFERDCWYSFQELRVFKIIEYLLRAPSWNWILQWNQFRWWEGNIIIVIRKDKLAIKAVQLYFHGFNKLKKILIKLKIIA